MGRKSDNGRRLASDSDRNGGLISVSEEGEVVMIGRCEKWNKRGMRGSYGMVW